MLRPVVIALSVGLATVAPVSLAEPADTSAAQLEPGTGLEVGMKAPSALISTTDGDQIDMADFYGAAPLVVTFYRGGWCPYCTKALAQMNDAMPDITRAGAKVIAISPELPASGLKTRTDTNARYLLYSDHQGNASRAYNVRFDLAADVIEKYKGYGVDLSKMNADKAWSLPHPATFVIDTKGMVRYAYVNADYTKRVDPAEVLAVLKELKAEADAAPKQAKP